MISGAKIIINVQYTKQFWYKFVQHVEHFKSFHSHCMTIMFGRENGKWRNMFNMQDAIVFLFDQKRGRRNACPLKCIFC